MTTVQAPPPREPPGEDGGAPCLVSGPTEILQLLQRLVDARCMLTTHAVGSDAGTLTALLQIDGDALLVDVPPSQGLLQQWLDSPRLAFEGRLERVAVRFGCGPARPALHAGRPALSLPLPAHVLHLQRREYLRCQPSGEPRCLLPAPTRDVGPAAIAARIHDLSGGGLALCVPAGARALDVDELIPGCTLELPGLATALQVTLRVRHVAAVAHQGRSMRQAGCEFVDLPATTQSALLRYVMRIERERALRRRGY